jgi:predicted N-formylglutamate amidohydrolase
VLSCEHGGNRVPAAYAQLFRGAAGLLQTHRGYDRGSLAFARGLARRLRMPLFAATTTRLLVDLNRTPGHPRVFSRYVRNLPEADLAELMRRFHTPPRLRVERAVEAAVAKGACVLHLAVHSFTPVLRGQRREVEVGLLYDPQRASERRYCELWQQELRAQGPKLRVRRNAPYRGSNDGLARVLRQRFADRDYLGLEIELNQKLLVGGRFPARIEAWISEAFARATSAWSDAAPRRGGQA